METHSSSESVPVSRPPAVLLLGACFFLSGATGLVYQVVWLRMLGLVFGHTVYATTTVLVAFMAGLGLGSFLLARHVHRLRDLIGAYGWLEIGIGIYCAILPLLLAVAATAYIALHRALGLSYEVFSLVQFGLVVVILLVPTTFMGGTLPVLGQALSRDQVGLGRTIGALYAVNTFGAVAGVALAGYVLLPALGNRRTLLIAAAANLTVGALALAYARARRGRARDVLVTGAAADAPARPSPLGPDARLTLIALGISGGISMIYEVAWTRALGLIVGSSTFAFTAMLLAFLIGIAGGSAAYSWIWGNRRATPRTFAALQAAIGLGTLGAMLLYEQLPRFFLAGLRWSDSPPAIQLIQLAICVGTLVVMTGFIGATFPAAVAAVSRSAAHAGRDVGRTYAINTVGCIGGSVLAGFVLIPAVGLHASLRLAGVANFLLAALLCVTPWSRVSMGRAALATAAALGALGTSLVPPWSFDVLASGVSVYAQGYLRSGWSQYLSRPTATDAIIFYRDGLTATVSVHQKGKTRFLRVNGKTDASTDTDMPTQLLLGHVPMLLHPAPREVAIIGLGSGITAGGVARYPLDRLDVVELEPAVREAARLFAEHNGGVLDDRRVRVWIADGRNYLLTTPRQYDVIVSEPSNPWIGGLASLFTTEMFQHARARLRPGGIMVQWLHGYTLDGDDLRMIVRTFASVFPGATLWAASRNDFMLVGWSGAAAVDLPTLKTRFESHPEAARDLGRAGVKEWTHVLGHLILGGADLARLAGEGPLNTDDRLTLEFTAPRALYRETADSNWQLIVGSRRAELPEFTPASRGLLEEVDTRHALGLELARWNLMGLALAQFDHALALDPRHAPSLVAASAASLLSGRSRQALELATRAMAVEPRNARACYLAGIATARSIGTSRAVPLFERAAALAPGDSAIHRAITRSRGWDLLAGTWTGGDEQDIAQVFTR